MIPSLLLFLGLLSAPGQGAVSDLEREAAALVETAPAQAADLLTRAAAELEARADGDPLDLARVLNGLSFALSRAARHGEALEAGERALAAARRVEGATPMSAAVLRNLAEVAARAGDTNRAFQYAEASVVDAQGAWGRTPLTAEYREFCARLALDLGAPEAAIDHLGRALAIYEKLFGTAEPDRLAGPLHELARALRMQGRTGSALDLNTRALRFLERAGSAGTPAWSAHALARLDALVELGELPTAAAELGPWIESMIPRVPPERRADAARDWARRWLGFGRPGEARRWIALLADAEGATALDRDLLTARAALLEGDGRAALAALDAAAQDLAHEARSPSAAAGSPVSVELELLRARALHVLGRDREAFDGLRAVFDLERERWGEDAGRLTPTYLGLLASELALHRTSPELIDLLDLLEASLGRVPPSGLAALDAGERLAGGRSAWDPALEGWVRVAGRRPERLGAALTALDRFTERRLVALRAAWIERGLAPRTPALRAFLGAQPSEPDLGREERARSAEALAAAVRRLRAEAPDLARALAPPDVSPARLRARLAAEDAVLVRFVTTAGGIRALVVPREGDARVVELGAAADLEALVRGALAGLRAGAPELDLAPLAARLLTPIWGAVESSAAVVLVADGPLAFVPFAALPTPEGEPWILRARLLRAVTVGRWLAGPAGPSSLSGAPGAHADGGPRPPTCVRHGLLLARLGTEPPEPPARNLARVLPPDDLVFRSELDLDRAREAGDLARLGLFSVRARSFVDGTVPSAGGLALGAADQAGRSLWERADGFLHLSELADLGLEGAPVVLWNARLVLSGTDPLGSEGLDALVAGLRDGGAGSVLLSLWPSVLEGSFGFDQALLRELRQGPAAGALGRAQRAWLSRPDAPARARHPSVWARLIAFDGVANGGGGD